MVWKIKKSDQVSFKKIYFLIYFREERRGRESWKYQWWERIFDRWMNCLLQALLWGSTSSLAMFPDQSDYWFLHWCSTPEPPLLSDCVLLDCSFSTSFLVANALLHLWDFPPMWININFLWVPKVNCHQFQHQNLTLGGILPTSLQCCCNNTHMFFWILWYFMWKNSFYQG